MRLLFQRSKATVLIFCVSLATQYHGFGDCASAFYTTTAQCSADKQKSDDAAWKAYNTAFDAAESKYNTQLALDAAVAASGKSACDAITVEGDPLAYEDYLSALADDLVLYNSDVDDCEDDDNCICHATAEYNKRQGIDLNQYQYWDLMRNADSQIRCYWNAKATQEQSDASAAATFWQEASAAESTRVSSLILDSWNFAMCNAVAGAVYTDCVLDADCAANVDNCCVDGCEKGFNDDMLAAALYYDIAVETADAEENSQLITCVYTRMHDSDVSYAWYIQSFDQDTGQYFWDMGDVDIKYESWLFMDGVTYDFQVETCACDGQDCTQEAQQTQETDDTLGDAWATEHYASVQAGYDAETASLDAALAAAYAQEFATETSCINAARQAYAAVVDAATTQYNVDADAALARYLQCLDDCDNG